MSIMYAPADNFLKSSMLLLLTCLFTLVTAAQPDTSSNKGAVLIKSSKPPAPVNGKTYAVIVGINQYKSPHIPRLNYAVADAEAFRDFLQSKAGGQVPPENIRIFLNDSATTGRFKNQGLKWLRLKAKKGDRVFLYFSGHGVSVNGGDSYFLAHNLAEDFSVENIEESGTQPLYQLKANCIKPLHETGVQVILIMDACRSEVADSLQSSSLSSFTPALKTAELDAGDIFCLSSSNGEASLETAKEGINHGIFTYFLLKGLYGYADNSRNANGLVTLNKLKNYVEAAVAEFTNERQRPIIDYKGNDNPLLAVVDTQLLTRMKAADLKGAGEQYAKNNRTNGKGLFRHDTIQLFRQFLVAIEKGPLWGKGSALSLFREMEISTRDLGLLQESALLLMSNLVDSGQAVINAYMSANQKLLKGYGQQLDRVFSNGARIFDTLYRISNRYFPDEAENKVYLKQYYFMKGRSQIYAASPKGREAALVLLQKARALDPQSAYINNSIGLYFKEAKRFDSALVYLNLAIASAPEWAYPVNTVGTVYMLKGYRKKAESCFQKAVSLSPRYPSPYINMGDLYTSMGQNQQAETSYKKALELLPCSGYASYQLGLLYRKMGRAEAALEAFRQSYQCDKNADAKKQLQGKRP